MKEGILLLFSVVLFTFPGMGQYDALLRSDLDSFLLELKSQEGKLQINWKELAPQSALTRKEYLDVLKIELQDADLIILYKLPSPDKQLYYKVKVNLQTVDRDSINPHAERVLQDYGIIEEGFKNEKRIIWTDLTEDVLYYGGIYRVYISAELWGQVDCSISRPAFGLNQQWPHYFVAGAGFTLLGVGQFYRQQQQKAYQKYEQVWLTGKNAAEGEAPYKDALGHYNNSKALTYSAWALLGANLAWSVFRIVKVKKKQVLYDRYCSEGTTTDAWKISPIIRPASSSIGLRLIW
ncbi:MAG: hypothetical protein SFV55_02020 [Haliscomenobacter sp.]|uniref:hypothetical protein n=1 Tax=Haliscomenobacter sp. TaxID=2717303 RepID=UPI0029BDB4AB|nr:hypothetical protein [Haliscomenobacter sp.]MDX2067168.1 hypothetical protein [Haliscomenobacter sp.]